MGETNSSSLQHEEPPKADPKQSEEPAEQPKPSPAAAAKAKPKEDARERQRAAGVHAPSSEGATPSPAKQSSDHDGPGMFDRVLGWLAEDF